MEERCPEEASVRCSIHRSGTIDFSFLNCSLRISVIMDEWEYPAFTDIPQIVAFTLVDASDKMKLCHG